MAINQISNQFSSIEQVTDQYLKSGQKAGVNQLYQGLSFEEILRSKSFADAQVSELKFSKHASMRLEDRNIVLSEEQMGRLQSGAMKASEKGIKESLVLIDSLAFIVNVPNRTVVTAMDSTESADNVYTNIDGAVIV